MATIMIINFEKIPDGENMSVINQAFIDHNVFIVWKPEYNLEISIVDEQHRGIVTIINSLYYGMQNKHADNENILMLIIGMTYDYTKIHFNIEESFLKKFNYPYVKQHNKLHCELIDTLSRVSRESLLNDDPYQFMEFLKKWWIDHICNRDRSFRNYLF